MRNGCAKGRIADAFLTGKKWNIPEAAEKPERLTKHIEMPKMLLVVLTNNINGYT